MDDLNACIDFCKANSVDGCSSTECCGDLCSTQFDPNATQDRICGAIATEHQMSCSGMMDPETVPSCWLPGGPCCCAAGYSSCWVPPIIPTPPPPAPPSGSQTCAECGCYGEYTYFEGMICGKDLSEIILSCAASCF
jgi:hypothetical protein